MHGRNAMDNNQVRSLRKFFIITVVVWAAMLALISTKTEAASGTCPQYEAKLRQYGMPVKEFSRIMYRESRCQEKAIGWNYHKGTSYKDCKLSPAATYKRCKAVRSYDSGLLQVNSGWMSLTASVCKGKKYDMTVLLNADCNLAVASVIYKESGIGNWRATSGRG